MADTKIKYEESFGIGTFKREITAQLGEQTWEKIIDGIVVPDMKTEAKCKCANMALFMERFNAAADKQIVKYVLGKVRHGLKPAQSAWAREKFLHIGDLDAFIAQQIEQGIQDFENMLKENKDFYGQPITEEVVEFVKANPTMLSGLRSGNKLYLSAFPAHMLEYIHAADTRMKRYYACHCPFAKESILSESLVSPALCNCSLGHVMNFWEAVFDTELEGEVLTSALNGDDMCSYVVTIPDNIMESYVKD